MDENMLDMALKVYSKINYAGREPSEEELDALQLSSSVIVGYILDKNPQLDSDNEEDMDTINSLFEELEVDYALRGLTEKGLVEPIFNDDGSITYEPTALCDEAYGDIQSRYYDDDTEGDIDEEFFF